MIVDRGETWTILFFGDEYDDGEAEGELLLVLETRGGGEQGGCDVARRTMYT